MFKAGNIRQKKQEWVTLRDATFPTMPCKNSSSGFGDDTFKPRLKNKSGKCVQFSKWTTERNRRTNGASWEM